MNKLINHCLTGSTLSVLLSVIFISSLSAQITDELETKPEHFIFTEFVNGHTILKSGDTIEAILNYNFLEEEMIFDDNGIKKAIGKLENIDTVYLASHKFVPVGDVFYELAVDEPIALFIQHRGKVTSKGTPAGYGGTSKLAATDVITSWENNGTMQLIKSPEEYDIINTTLFWVRKDEAFYRANCLRDVQKILPEKSQEIKRIIKKRNTDFRNISEMKILTGHLNRMAKQL